MVKDENSYKNDDSEDSSFFSTVDEQDEVTNLNLCYGGKGSDQIQDPDEKTIDLNDEDEEEIIATTNNYIDDELNEIQELRKRLERRNLLLDVVRKAYHRDVLVVKNSLLRNQQQRKESCEALQSSDTKVTSNYDRMEQSHTLSSLSSIPSIDLRHTGLHLFSPQECELRLHPCQTCGGHYEVIHRESSRYASLLQCRDNLLEKISGLELDLGRTNQRVLDCKEELRLFQECAEKKTITLNLEIDRLIKHAADYDSLKRLSQDQQQELLVLLEVKKEKESLEKRLKSLEQDFENERNRNTSLSSSIHERNDEIVSLKTTVQTGLEREAKNNDTILSLEVKNGHLKEDITKMNETICELEKNLERCREEVKGLNETIKVIEDDANFKQNALEAAIQHHKASINELTSSLKGCHEKILHLECDSHKEQVDHQKFRAQMLQDLQNCEMEAKRRKEEDEIKKGVLSKRIAHLMTMTSSYIQNLYEQCLTQEELISLENQSMSRNNKRINESKQSIVAKNKKNVHLIIERLEKRIESIHIDWEGLLKDDDDRRVVFGNLNNRSQINHSQIDDLIKQIHVRRKSDLEKTELNHSNAINELKCKQQTETSLLKDQIEVNKGRLMVVESTLKSTKNDLDIAKAEIVNLMQLQENYKNQISRIEFELSMTHQQCEKSQGELTMIKSHLEQAKSMILVKNEVIKDQNETLQQLEAILEKTTRRYAMKLEEERIRLETNVDIGVQSTIPVSDFFQQTDFIQIKKNERVDSVNGRQNIKTKFIHLK